jgi:nitrate/nitrite transporter NarK
VQNGIGNLAGVAAPALTGMVVERTGQFFRAFAVATGIVLVGAFFLYVRDRSHRAGGLAQGLG